MFIINALCALHTHNSSDHFASFAYYIKCVVKDSWSSIFNVHIFFLHKKTHQSTDQRSIKFKPFWSWWKTFTFLRKKNQAKDRKCRSHWTTILNEILNMFPSKMKIVDCWSNFGQLMKNGKTNIFRKRNNQPNYTVCCPKEHMNFHYGYVFFFNKKNRT